MDEPVNGNGAAPDTTRFPSPEQVPVEMRIQAAEIRALEANVLLARARFAQQSGITFNGARDEYIILGYDATITVQQYRDEYLRGGIAGRVVDVMPDATWRGQPAFELIEDEDPEVTTPFEEAWNKIEKKHQIGGKLLRVDKLARLSTFGVLLIGDGGDLSKELRKVSNPDKLLYLMPFLGGGGPGGSTRNQYRVADFGSDCSIFEYDEDPTSERFGLPKTYSIKRTDLASPVLQRPVHWSRIIHVAEGLLDDEVFGIPALERIWNLLIDLRKVTGGGAEAFWLRANQGMHIDVDKDMTLSDASGTIAALKEQAEEYKHQLTRWIRTRGVKVQTLGSDVANFESPADAIITQIAGAKGIPKRILTGSEMGELASSQDRENFRDLVIGRQLQYAGPYIVRQLADRFIKYGYLPSPSKGVDEYDVLWPHIQVLTENEKVQGAQGMAGVNSTYGDLVFTDAEIRDKWFLMAPLTDEQRAEVDERAEEKMKKQQEAMAAMQPQVPGEEAPDESALDFDLDVEEDFKAAEDGSDLRTALEKFEEHEHPRASDGKFGSGGGSASGGSSKGSNGAKGAVGDGPPDAMKRTARRTFKSGLVNLHLKLNDKDAKAVEEAHAKATKAGFQGSQLSFMQQQLALSVAKDGDPVVKFDKKTIEAYKALRKTAIASGQPKPSDPASKLGPEWKAEKSGTIDGYKNAKTGQWVPADHPIVTGEKTEKPPEKSKKTAAKAKAAKAESKKSAKGSSKGKKDAKSEPADEGIDRLAKDMKDDEKQALDEGYRKAKSEGYEGSKTEFLQEQLELYGTAEEGDPRLKTFFYGATIDAYKKLAKNRAAQSAENYSLSSTQIQLPPTLAEMLLAFGKSIPAFDLCDEEGGLEDDAHITVKYGLHTNSAADVRKALATYVGPIRFTLGKTNIFQSEHYDVLYVEVFSPDLIALNSRLSNALENTTTHPIYKPHATVGYLKPGLGVRYVGLNNLEGMSAVVGTVRFSPVEGEDVDLRITGRDDVNGQFAAVNQPLPLAHPKDLYVLEAPELHWLVEGLDADSRQRFMEDLWDEWNLKTMGGPGSGNFGHAGRPGQVGGSADEGGENKSGFALFKQEMHKLLPSGIGWEKGDWAKFKSDIKEHLFPHGFYKKGDLKKLKEDLFPWGFWTETTPEEYKAIRERQEKESAEFFKKKMKYWGLEERSLESREDVELLRVLTAAIEIGATDVVHKIVGLGGPGSGNFGHEGRPGQVGGSGEGGSVNRENYLKRWPHTQEMEAFAQKYGEKRLETDLADFWSSQADGRNFPSYEFQTQVTQAGMKRLRKEQREQKQAAKDVNKPNIVGQMKTKYGYDLGDTVYDKTTGTKGVVKWGTDGQPYVKSSMGKHYVGSRWEKSSDA